MHPITAVISFCSNDWRYLKACVEAVRPICTETIVTVCTHFFDGSEENYALLEEAYRCFPECTYLLFTFDPQKSYRPFSPLYPEHPDWRHEWHNTGRYLSYFYSSPDTEYLFFLDADEIIDTERFLDWGEYSACRFAGLWYFREAKFEADNFADLSLLVRKRDLHPDFLWDEDERTGVFHRMPGEKKLGVLGADGLPLIRHYGGVRPKEELLKKCSAWGHHAERDWQNLIEEEFSRPFNGQDFMRRYQYREVKPTFDPLSVLLPKLPEVTLQEHLKGLHRFPNVIMVNPNDSFKRQLANEFGYDH
jgi:hypothetical protein